MRPGEALLGLCLGTEFKIKEGRCNKSVSKATEMEGSSQYPQDAQSQTSSSSSSYNTACSSSESEKATDDEQENVITPDERLDIYSEKFDPLLALYSPDFVIPDPSAPVLDNVGVFISRFERGGLRSLVRDPYFCAVKC